MTTLVITLFAGVAIGYFVGARFHPPRNRTTTPPSETQPAPDRDWDLFKTLHQERFEQNLRDRRHGNDGSS